MTASNLTVIAAPVLDPGAARVRKELPLGLTIAQIVTEVAPGQQPSAGHLRVSLTSADGTSVILERYWPHIRPKNGTTVVVRGVPGNDTFRSVLLAVVSIAANIYAPGLGAVLLPGLSTTTATAIAAAGLSIVGSLLVNALIPVETPDAEERRNVYRIDGWRNELRAGAPVPLPLGMHRYAPPFAAQSYTEIVGDEQYIRALFCFGYGPVRLSDFRIGETDLADYDDVDYEVREGRDGDAPVTLFPEQVLEEVSGVQLVRPQPRDLAGEIVDDEDTIETPVERFTASNSARASVILGFQAGLFKIDSKGRRKSRTVTVRIRARLNGEGDWTEVVTLDVTGESQESFMRQHSWTLPVRGRWQIEVTRMTDDSTDTQISDVVTLTAIQSIRPEYPINLDKPLALVAVRIRATYQLNGSLDAFNAMVEREGLVREAGAWVQGYSRNPATAYLTALMSAQNPYPVEEPEIDMEQIADWYDWCDEKGLKYDRVHDAAEGLGDMLNSICSAGRATPRHDGVQWGVVIDRPETLVIDHISPRNSEQFDWDRGYFAPPDGLRVAFLDETNNYEQAERVVPWPGYTGDVRLTESIDLPGKTDPDEIYIEARRRMYELIHRPDSFSAIQSGVARVATRGDLVMGSYDVLTRTQAAARVTGVSGQAIGVDELILVGEDYGVRFRVYADNEDVIGTSVVRPIAASSEETGTLLLRGTGYVPEAGDIVHVGPLETVDTALRVRGIEAGDDFSSRLIMIAAAPEIDTLTDAEIVPEWDGRVGAEIDLSSVAPMAPVFAAINTGIIGTDTAGGLQVLLRPGAGSTAPVTSYELDHRAAGATVWQTVSVPAASSAADVDIYSFNDEVDLRARAYSNATESDVTATATVTIGGDDPDLPGALDAASITVEGGLGHTDISVLIPADNAPASLRIYRVPADDILDRDTHALGAAVEVVAGTTYVRIDGDGTRQNLVSNGDFNAATDWIIGAPWVIANGVASMDGGSAGLNQDLSLIAGETYRLSFDLLDYVSGRVRPLLRGDSYALAGNKTAAGSYTDSLVAPANAYRMGFLSGDSFDGAIDNVSLFLVTAGSAPAGTWDYYIEAFNDEDIAAPISGPFQTKIY